MRNLLSKMKNREKYSIFSELSTKMVSRGTTSAPDAAPTVLEGGRIPYACVVTMGSFYTGSYTIGTARETPSEKYSKIEYFSPKTGYFENRAPNPKSASVRFD